MTKEIHDINTRALDFVVDLIEYIFEYPDDDYMTMECLCRKLYKYGLVDKKDGFYLVAGDTLHKAEPQTEMPRCSINGTPFDECGFCEYFNCDTCQCEADATLMERSK